MQIKKQITHTRIHQSHNGCYTFHTKQFRRDTRCQGDVPTREDAVDYRKEQHGPELCTTDPSEHRRCRDGHTHTQHRQLLYPKEVGDQTDEYTSEGTGNTHQGQNQHTATTAQSLFQTIHDDEGRWHVETQTIEYLHRKQYDKIAILEIFKRGLER